MKQGNRVILTSWPYLRQHSTHQYLGRLLLPPQSLANHPDSFRCLPGQPFGSYGKVGGRFQVVWKLGTLGGSEQRVQWIVDNKEVRRCGESGASKLRCWYLRASFCDPTSLHLSPVFTSGSQHWQPRWAMKGQKRQTCMRFSTLRGMQMMKKLEGHTGSWQWFIIQINIKPLRFVEWLASSSCRAEILTAFNFFLSDARCCKNLFS